MVSSQRVIAAAAIGTRALWRPGERQDLAPNASATKEELKAAPEIKYRG